MGRHSNQAERKTQIAWALAQVMAEKGYDRASINDIAQVAGLRSGLLHYHFKNKQQILLKLLELLSERFAERTEAAMQNVGPSAKEQLRALLKNYLDIEENADPQGVQLWVALSAEAVKSPEVRQVYHQALEVQLDAFRPIIGQLAQEPGLKMNTEEFLALLLATIQGFFLNAAAAPKTIVPGAAFRSVLLLCESLMVEK